MIGSQKEQPQEELCPTGLLMDLPSGFGKNRYTVVTILPVPEGREAYDGMCFP